MTIWAAYAAFQELSLGTIEAGKDATIVMFESAIHANELYSPNFAYMTFINGEKVYSVE
jgi:predicted amidohydrolase YtcJ